MKLKANKKIIGLSLSLIIAAVFLFANPVHAAGNWGLDLLSGICSAIVGALGWVLVQIMSILVYFAQYNGFITSAAVVNGWVIVRDVCNMFFVLILLIIAFATILQIEEYNYKKWLPKLILMAVLINFSKTICGLLIDAAQIVMLTFVNSFKDIVGANLTSALGIADWTTLKDTSTTGSGWEVAAVLVLAVIYVVIAITVVSAMLAMIAMRIVMLWIFVVLSPIAYLTAAFPGGKSYSSKWWSQFTQNLVVGPVLAFFIWLSFTSLTSFSSSEFMTKSNSVGNGTAVSSSTGQFGTSNTMVKFVIAIGMLLGGMRIAKEIGGDAADAAGSVFEKGNKMAIGGAKLLGGAALMGAMHPVNHVVDKLQEKGIVDLNLKRAWTTMQARRKDYKAEQYSSGLEAAGKRMDKGGVRGALAMTAGPSDAYDRVTDWKGIKPVGIIKQWRGEKSMNVDKEEGIKEKEEAERKFQNNKFNDEFINADATKRSTLYDDATLDTQISKEGKDKAKVNMDAFDADIAQEEARGQYKDVDKIKELQDKKTEEKIDFDKFSEDEKVHSANMVFASGNIGKTFGDKDKFETKQEVKKSQKDIDKAEKKISDNIPMDTRQARIAEQSIVSKKMGELKDISDPSELLRMLKTSIGAHDKSMVKAIMLKMSKDGNDNEALQPLTGRTDHIGLKDLMKQLSTKGSKNYAGFHEQEAFGLGSQVAEINKGTNHWAATSAYEMDNGKWRETTNKEHHNIRDIETGKQQLQTFIRNNNRLAYGYHDEGGTFHIDAGGVIKLKAIDTVAGHKNVETMNESAAQHVYAAIMANDKLKTMFGQKIKNANGAETDSLLDALKNRIGALTEGGGIDKKLSEAEELLKK